MKVIQKKEIALVLLCLLMMFTPIVAKAQPTEIAQPYTICISESDASLVISAQGVASVSAYVRGKTGTTSTSVQVTLQAKSGSTWQNIKSWSRTSNSSYTSINVDYSVPKGTYRIVAKVKANTESKTITSASRTY